jgi:hypothetical protein
LRLAVVKVRRLGGDSLEIDNQTDRFHARVDRAGRLLNVTTVRGRAATSVERVRKLDLAALLAAFAARERQASAR